MHTTDTQASFTLLQVSAPKVQLQDSESQVFTWQEAVQMSNCLTPFFCPAFDLIFLKPRCSHQTYHVTAHRSGVPCRGMVFGLQLKERKGGREDERKKGGGRGERRKEEGGRKTADFCKILDLKCYILILLKEATKPNSVSRGIPSGTPCGLCPYKTPSHLTGVTCPAPLHMGF